MRIVNIIPTYNEAENILLMLKALAQIATKLKKHKVLTLVVDDNSPDGTGELVKQIAKKDPSVVLLSGIKEGLGKAMIRGINYAVTKLKADVVIPNEADFAFDPEHIPYMVDQIEKGVDVVVGSRHVGSGHTEGWTSNRKINHWVANTFFATWVAGIWEVGDHNGAFRAVRVKGVQDKLKMAEFPTGFGFFCYWLFKLTQVTSKIKEFPVTYKFRTRGESKVSFNPKYFKTYLRDVLEYITLAFKIRLERHNILV